MKKKRMIFVVLALLIVGFAAVATNLGVLGSINIGSKNEDFQKNVIFTRAQTEAPGTSSISEDGKTITFTSKELAKINEEAILNFDITNKNLQYDANATIQCVLTEDILKDYLTITPNEASYIISASGKVSGNIAVKLIKSYAGDNISTAFTCTINANAEEREKIIEPTYSFSSVLTDKEGNYLDNTNLVVYSDTPHYITTDVTGYFQVLGLEKGEHELYVMENQSLDNIQKMDKSTIKENASRSANFSLSDHSDLGSSTSCTLDSFISVNDLKETLPEKDRVKVLSGNGLTPGDEIKIETESFYVLNHENGQLLLIGENPINEKTQRQGEGTLVGEFWLTRPGTSGAYRWFNFAPIKELMNKYDNYMQNICSSFLDQILYQNYGNLIGNSRITLLSESQYTSYNEFIPTNFSFYLSDVTQYPVTIDGKEYIEKYLWIVHDRKIVRNNLTKRVILPAIMVKDTILNY